ncbi:MAG TPA: DNA polymerase III subunit gamma/tau [Bacillota bacterium]|jgi:DNA polymerase-3 subunit gamma/tau|nr:DNA polymerase III subunit gamma/tau [Fastidiosipila sp.]HPX92769.1 DNA polymerase III subunit gamma/tau [Bacillota bacterium]HQB80666.1 DNA polymerase III subunit gamma/tau [Bacillota bacterium]
MTEMDNLALYRLWRPQTFSDMVGQEQVVFPLRQSIIDQKFSHALLFSGTRGTGKTSLAKIFAKAINCLNPDRGDPCNQCEICLAANDGSLMDINEIDAASHNSVDHIRRLTDEIVFTPVRAAYKVYIIDEVHMLSQGAFNALLKTLEEPPAHAVFIMATTEPHRIPATIMSRCQHFQFRRIPKDQMIERLAEIAKSIPLAIEDDALEIMAQIAGGALRDAISLLDQTRQLKAEKIGRDDVLLLAGRVPDEFLSETARSMIRNNPESLLTNIQELVMSGRDLTRFVTDLGGFFRNLLVARVSDKPESLIQMRHEDISQLQSIAQQSTASGLTDVIVGLAELQSSLRFSPDIRTSLEIGLLRLASLTGRQAEVPVPQKDPASKERPKKETSLPAPQAVPAQAKSPAQETFQAPDSCGAPGSEKIETQEGEELLLPVWRDILDLLLRERRFDISLCARPARVMVREGFFDIRFDNNLFGQYACLNKRESIELIEELLLQRTGKRYPVRITLDESLDQSVGATAEWRWLKDARDQALSESLPEPFSGADNPQGG